MLATPLVVKNARFTRERSVGRTNRCWKINNPMKSSAPIQYVKPKRAYMPAEITNTAELIWSTLAIRSAVDFPKLDGML